MTNIEKIKAEIERMHQEAVLAACGNDTDWLRSRIGTCVYILAFINSLPEETCKDSLQVPETCKENTDSFTSLEEAAARYERENRESILSSVDIVDGFKAGAEWQKKQDAARRK